jgi:hypothetical protein
MHRSRRRLASTAVATALALAPALGACSDEDPGSRPTSPSSESPSPPLTESTTPSSATSSPSSPSPSPPSAEPSAKPTPEQPPVSREDTQEGAVAFTFYFVDVLNYTSESGNVSTLDSLSAGSCVACGNIVDVTRKTYKAGGYIKDSHWEVLSHSSIPDGDRWQLSLDVRASAQTYKPSADEPVERRRGGRYVMSMTLERSGDGWRVQDLEIV